MKINNLEITSNFIEIVDSNSAHVELNNCIRLVHLTDTNFTTIEELEQFIQTLII